MLRSLVGSEMCIRDRYNAETSRPTPERSRICDWIVYLVDDDAPPPVNPILIRASRVVREEGNPWVRFYIGDEEVFVVRADSIVAVGRDPRPENE